MGRSQKKENANQVRIIGGSHRSRLIHFVDQEGLRPTSDRIRETLFNWLQERIFKSRCLDLFAGSGALGFEALSRGADHVQFVESSAVAAKAIQSNLHDFEFSRGQVKLANAEQWLALAVEDTPFDIVFLDPPYADKKLLSICQQLAASSCVQPGTLVYLENNSKLESQQLPLHWKALKTKKAGQVHFHLIEI